MNVPARREERAELIGLTQQDAVPALEDGDRVVLGSHDIIEYLRASFPAPEDAADHVASGQIRSATLSSLAPDAALARLTELLALNDLEVYAEIGGGSISERLPAEYALLMVGAPACVGQGVRRRPGHAGRHRAARRRATPSMAAAPSRLRTPSARSGCTATRP